MKTYKPKFIKLLRDKSGKAGGIPVRVFGSTKKPNWLGIVGIGLLIGAGLYFGQDLAKASVQWATKAFTGEAQSSISDATLTEEEKMGQQEIKIDIPNENLGTASTLSLTSYDRMADTETSVTTVGWIFDSNGNKLVNGASIASSSPVWGDTVSVYVQNATFIMYEFENGVFKYPMTYEIDSATPAREIDVAKLSAESSMSMTAFDSQKNALSAETDAGDVDYTYSVGADGEKVVYVWLENAQADALYPLGALCTFASMNSTVVDDYKVVDSRFKEVNVPKELDDVALSFTISDYTCTQTGYDRCYVPDNANEVMFLEEWDDTDYIKTTAKAGSTDPTNASCSGVGLVAIDIGFEDGKDGNIYWDFYKHDDDEQVTAVGISDTTTSPQGGTSGVLIELI